MFESLKIAGIKLSKIKNKKNQWLCALLTMLIGISFIYFFSKSFSRPATINKSQEWITYKNREYNFSFDYPKNWFIGENASSENGSGLNLYLRPETLNVTDPTYGVVKVWIFTSTQKLNDFINTKYCNTKSGCNVSKIVTEFKLGNMEAVTLDTGGPLPTDTVLVKNGDTILKFQFLYQGENKENYSNKEEKQEFDHILSTLKALE